MKNFIKNNLKVFVSIFVTTIIVGSVSVYAASQYFAKDINFTPTNENFKKENGEAITNVEDALNELYTTISKDVLNVLELKMRTLSNSRTYPSTTNYMIFNTKLPEYYQYFKITGHKANSYVGSYVIHGHYKDNTYLELEENVEYSFEDYKNIWTDVWSNVDGKEADLDVYISFYNK